MRCGYAYRYEYRYGCVGVQVLGALVLPLAFVLAACTPPEPAETRPSPAPPALPAATAKRAERPPRPAADPGHARMLALLQEVAARTPEEHFYLGDGLARRLRERLAELPPSAPARERWKLDHQAGVVELRLGNVRDAIARFQEARRLAGPAELADLWRARTTFDLGMAWMRLGEVENCCRRFSPESCILPLRGGAIHTAVEGSREAIRCFTEVLRGRGADRELRLKARWLLNVAHMTLGTYPDGVPPDLRVPPARFETGSGFPRFRNIARELGLDTSNLSGGAIVDDLDGDGLLDILTSTWDTLGPMHFFHNAGDGTFVERTSEAGLDGLLGGLNMKQADYDNDGDLDVLVLRGAWLADRGRHPNSLLRNDGRGRFTDVTFAAGLGEVHYPTQTAGWADYDNDGDLDLYIGNETSKRIRAPCQLFRNEGDGTFTDVAAAAGVENLGYTKAVTWGDYDGDGDPDLYVSNLREPNRLYRNNGDGTFTDVAPEAGVTRPRVSFPAWFWDFDNDGALDIFVASYAGRVSRIAAFAIGEPVEEGRPCLYRGDGRGGFEEIAGQVGLIEPMLPMGSNYGDIDGDGFLDFYLGTGDPDFASLMPNLLWVNRGGERFENMTVPSGLGHLQKGHAVSFADLDNDGDLDVFEEMGGAFRGDPFRDALYENPGFGTRWVCLDLRGTRSNRRAVGARIRVRVRTAGGEERSIYRHVTSGGSFGASPLRQTIGLGDAAAIDVIEVLWPASATAQRFRGAALDRGYRIVEGRDRLEPIELPRVRLGGPRQASRGASGGGETSR